MGSEQSNNNRANREFSKEVKNEERWLSHNSCRMCGIDADKSNLEYAHIYSASKSLKMKRTGGIDKRWLDDEYVKSSSNCLLLCHDHHKLVDSSDGLIIYTVEYLESLKLNINLCTTLINKNNNLVRCHRKSKRGQILDNKLINNEYLCKTHVLKNINKEFIDNRTLLKNYTLTLTGSCNRPFNKKLNVNLKKSKKKEKCIIS